MAEICATGPLTITLTGYVFGTALIGDVKTTPAVPVLFGSRAKIVLETCPVQLVDTKVERLNSVIPQPWLLLFVTLK